MKKSQLKKSFMSSIALILVCVMMLASTTYAWFTDSVTSGVNKIVAGNLDVELKHYTTDSSAAETVQDTTQLFDIELWEPGAIAYENFVVSNEGTVALKFDLTMNVGDYNTTVYQGETHDLTEVLKVAILDEAFTGDRVEAQALTYDSTLSDFSKYGELNPKGQEGATKTYAVVVYWEPTANDNIYNVNNGRTTSDGEPLFVELGINLVAAQKDYEEDAFDNEYDKKTKTHEHEYKITPKGTWKCVNCNAIYDGTEGEYIMVNSKTSLTDADLTGTNAVVAIPLAQVNATALEEVGLTIIKTTNKTTYKLETQTDKTIYIRTSGNDLVIDAPNATVYHYGKAVDVYVMNVAGHSLYENANVKDVVIMGSGHVEIGATASVNDLSVAKLADAENVTITLVGQSDNVGTIAVYDNQKSITVEKKEATTTVTTTPEEMKAAEEPVVIIPDNKTARIGTELYDTLAEALTDANAQGDAGAARLVNNETLQTAVEVPADTVLKISAFTQLKVEEDVGVTLKGTGVLVNVGQVLSVSEEGSTDETSGLTIEEQAKLINYGGMFDSIVEEKERAIDDDTTLDDDQKAEERAKLVDGGIFNKDGQVITNNGTIDNLGTIENEGAVTSLNEINNAGTITNEGALTNSGTLDNSGTITNNNTLTNSTDSSLTNSGTITNEGALTNSGTLVNDGEINNGETNNTANITNDGTVTNKGKLTNDGTITNNSGAELNLQSGSTEGDGDIVNNGGNVLEERQTGEDAKTYYARVASTYYESITDAFDALNEGKSKTLTMLANATANAISIHGVENVTIDLGTFTLTTTVTLYDCNGVTIKNGSVVNTNGTAFRIGEHQSTTVRMKDYNNQSQYGVSGPAPLKPAQNVVLDGLNVTAKTVFSYTNVEDEYTRTGHQKLYGNWIVGNGYTKYEDYTSYNLAAAYNAFKGTDSVTVNGGRYQYSTLVKSVVYDDEGTQYPAEGYSIELAIEKKVLVVNDNVNITEEQGFSDAQFARFTANGIIVVAETDSLFKLTNEAPDTYTAKLNNVYFCYEGGADDAITSANFGETVTIRENATVEKTFAFGQKLDIVSDNGSTWTGATATKGYEVAVTVDEEDDNLTHYVAVANVVARLYRTTNNTASYAGVEYVEYGTLQEAFDAAGMGNIVVLMKDITLSTSDYDYWGSQCGIHCSSKGVGFDLNGHTYTYTGNGAAYLSTTQSGSSGTAITLRDSSGGKGKIVATKGYCFHKRNKSTEEIRFYGGTYISQADVAIKIDEGKSTLIYGGTFISETNYALTFGSKSEKCEISGGTFISNKTSALQSNISEYCSISGGTFTSANGKDPVTGKYTITAGTFVTRAGEDGKQTVQTLVRNSVDYTLTIPAGATTVLPSLNRVGYIFDGWYDSTNTAKVADGGEQFAAQEETVLKSHWTERTAFKISITKQENATVTVTVNGEAWNGTDTLAAGDTVLVTVSYSKSNNQSCTIKDENGKTYTAGTSFAMPKADVTIEASSSDGCFAAGTMITLADGTTKAIEAMDGTEKLRAWNFLEGKYESADIFCITNHGENDYAVTTLTFGDKTSLDIIGEQGLFNATVGQFVNLSSENASDFIGDEFVLVNGESNQKVTLTAVKTEVKKTTAYSLISVNDLDVVANDLLTLDCAIYFLIPFAIDDDLKINAEAYAADVAQYGLLTYEEFSTVAPFMTETQFNAGCGQYINIALGKGIVTMEEISDYATLLLKDQQELIK